MSVLTLRESIQSLLKKEAFLPHADIVKQLKKDKARVSGYLEAMVDFGELSVKKAGNSKVYFLNNNKRA